MNQVVFTEVVAPGVMHVVMRDEDYKNTFSEQLVAQLLDTFAQIAQDDSLKVVVLSGYDHYFCAGGSQKGLLAFSDGQGQFTDTPIYSLALDCPIPVISAMQGHGIGGGFVMGLFADFVILGKENIYTTNFMKYGFTPGMGATYIVPHKLGPALGHEMLLNAQNFRGEQLKQRGVPYPVYPKAEVLEKAFALANEVAQKPRISLVTLKAHLTAPIKAALPDVIAQEIKMHEVTFHQPQVKQRIEALF